MNIKEILDREGYVVVDPDMMCSPQFRIMHAIKDEIRVHKWKHEQLGKSISWGDARKEWLEMNKKEYKKLFKDIFKYGKEEQIACTGMRI